VDPTSIDNLAVQLASQNGHLEVVRFLCCLPQVDPSDSNNRAVRLASQLGYIEVVNFLLTQTNVHL
jgi:hypothetical protein